MKKAFGYTRSLLYALFKGDYNKLQSIVDKRILAPIYPQFRRKNTPNFLIMTNNTCNLKCCNCTITDAPWGTQETSTEAIKSFCQNTKGWRPENYIQLSGGEVTILPPKKITEILKEIELADRRSSIYTNGFNPKLLSLFDHIILDDHGVNHKEIVASVNYLKTKREEGWNGHFDVRHSLYHYDLREAIKGNITEGCRCSNWNNRITLWMEAVYPCCVMPAISAFNGIHDQLQKNLKENGWNPWNKDLPQTIENWRETLPVELYRLCQIGCWKGGDRKYTRISKEEQYWESRYAEGGNSGAGSTGIFRKWKWDTIFRYTPDLAQVIDIGCGDLRFWENKQLTEYIGIDKSKTIIDRNAVNHPQAKFIHSPAENYIPDLQAPTVLCIDLLFHIMNDTAYLQILENLCKYSTDLVFIYTWQTNPWRDKTTDGKYQTYRPLENYFHIFEESGFNLVERVPCHFDIGAMYVFQRSIPKATADFATTSEKEGIS
jgi:hypothetical protein